MIPNYSTVTISAEADENVLPLIYEEVKKTGYHAGIFTLKFVGFMMAKGTSFKINGNPLKVPDTGVFYSPFANSKDYLQIYNLSFDEAISDADLWIIY